MSAEHHHKSHTVEYVVVFFVLAILTGLELMIPDLNTEYKYKAIDYSLKNIISFLAYTITY